MAHLYERVVTFLESEGWPVEKVEGRTALRTSHEDDNGQWNCVAMVNEDEARLVFFSVFPHDVKANRYTAVGEYLNRANYGLPVGNFEIDYSDGMVRFKTSIEFGEADASPELIGPVVYANVTVMNRYLPGLLRVVQGTAPEKAIEDTEKNSSE